MRKASARRTVADRFRRGCVRRVSGVLELFEDEHAGPFAQDEAVAIAVERTAGALGLVVAGREGGQQDESGHAERMDHAVRAAGEDHVGVAAADQLEGFADRLRAGGAGGQAVRVGPLGPEDARQVAGGRSGLLLGLADGMQLFDSQPGEFGRVDVAVAGASGATRLTNLGKSCWPSPEPR